MLGGDVERKVRGVKMNTIIQRILIYQSNRYKTNYEKHLKYKQLYQEAVTNLETAKSNRKKLLTDLEQFEQNPTKVKETIRIYDKEIIPKLKKEVWEAENQSMKHDFINWYDPDVIICLVVSVGLIVPCIFYGGILGSVVAAVLIVMIWWLWWIYRCSLRKIAYKGGI